MDVRTVPARLTAPSRQPQYLDPGVAAARLEQGRTAEFTAGTPDPAVAKNGAPAYFRTYDQVKQAALDLQAKYPNLVKVETIGQSVDKRDIIAMRLTNQKSATTNKPRVLNIGGTHAREIANPELLMKWATQTLAHYGTDPNATAMLDNREIDIVPIMNVDGHVIVEQGYAQHDDNKLWQRKNDHAPDGTDLNRNYEFHWGGPGASTDPYSETYRGPNAASEPEVKAIEKFVADNKPALQIDWHSYSRLNLFPWGDTHNHAPDYQGLMNLAKKFSTFNHYTPEQAIDLYPTSGASKDFSYGTFKIPAFTIETGDNFHQSDQEFAATWAENAPVLDYVAKVADDPFGHAKGPDTLDVHVATGAPGVGAGSSLITAQISDAGSGGDAIRAAEWVTDPSVAAGQGTPLAAADGRFDAPSELVKGSAPATGGRRLVYVRAQDSAGNWGPATAQWLGAFDTPSAPATTPTAPAAPAAPAQP